MERLFTSAKQFCKSDSSKTTVSYRCALTQFGLSKYGNGVPEEEIFSRLDKYIRTASRQDVLDDLRNFKDYLDTCEITKRVRGNEITTPYAIKTKMLRIAIIQAWLTKNELGLPKAYNGEFTYKEKPETDDLPFTHESAMAVYHQLKSPIARCIFLFLLVTGCRIDEATHVKTNEITWDYKLQDGSRGPVRIRLDESYAKNGRARIVFLTKEAEDLLKEVWTEKQHLRVSRRGPDHRREEVWNTGRGLYLMSTAGKRLSNFPNIKSSPEKRKAATKDDRLFPVSTQTIEEVLSKAIQRAGYVEMTKTHMNKLHVHSTRKFFRTEFGQAAGPDAAETIMGHSSGLTHIYRQIQEGPLAVLYHRHQGSLGLFRDRETDIVRERVDRQTDQILAQDARVAAMESQMKLMQAKLALVNLASNESV